MLNVSAELGSILRVDHNVPMSAHTTFKSGGACDIMLLPKTTQELLAALDCLTRHHTPWVVLGNGSNTLFGDSGFRGAVIKMTDFCKVDVNLSDNTIFARSGTSLAKLAHAAQENSLTGLEFASGIPGTVGGGLIMNAGAYDGEMSNLVLSSTYVDGGIQKVMTDHEFSYRYSVYQRPECKNYIVTGVTFKLNKGDKQQIKEKSANFNRLRREKQPLEYPSFGSVFKRPPGDYAGRLIQECGLKGFRAGGAMVSEKHSGFIINYDHATTKDALDVINHVQQNVLEKFGVSLQCEVKFIGL